MNDAVIEAEWERHGPRWNTPLMKAIRQAERDRYRLFQPMVDAAQTQCECDQINKAWGRFAEAENDIIGQRHGLPPMLHRSAA
jgi:hypothetical protein